MALLDTDTPPPAVRSAEPQPSGVATERPGPFQRSELRRRGVPFLLTIVLALVLLPFQEAPRTMPELAIAIMLLAAVFAAGVAVSRAPNLPRWVGALLPYLLIVAVTVLRDATGGPLSGYGALLFLAPFWVALYDSRRQLLLVILAMFLAQAWAWSEAGFVDPVDLRRIVLTTVVIGMGSAAIQRKVQALRHARAELAEANVSLERSNRELEQFAYVSSHDIQEPLRMIRSFSQLFVQRHGDRLDAEGHELLGYVVDGAERAQALVDDLLQYSRIGSSERPFAPVALDEALDRALASLAPTIDATRARIEREGALPTVQGDAPQLESLFLNLVGNALKYRHAERDPVVHIASSVDDHGRVHVTIIDNGIGFDPEHAERIFGMFARLHGRGAYEGTGIGLAICARIAERHGGSITAEGRPGEGATFHVTIGAAA